MKRVIVTGGPGSGKTSLVEYMKEQGFETVGESALLLIKDLKKQMGTDGQKTWRKENPAKFQDMVAEKSAELELFAVSSESKYVFFDRGMLDGLAYCKHNNVDPPLRLSELAKSREYHYVFLLDVLGEDVFEKRKGTARMTGREGALKLSDLILGVYEEHGYTPVKVPVMSVEDRANLILNYLEDNK